MDELRKPANFNKLKAFFTELRSVGFNLRRVPGIFTVNRLQVKKEEALRLLRLLPEFAGEDFKKDEYLSQFLLKNQTKLAGLLDGLSPQQQAELRDLLLKPEMTTAEQASQPAMQGPAEAGSVSQPPLSGGSGGGMPSMPSVSAPAVHPIFRTKPPAAETPKPDIAIANSSGHVTEAGDPSKLVQTTSTGHIKEAGQPSKLVSSTGAPLHEHPAPSPQSLNRASIRGWSSSGFKRLQNFASPANPFLKTNLNRIGEGFKSMFGNLGNAGGRALLGGLNLGGNTAGRLSNFRSSLGGKMRGAGSRTSSAIKGGGKKFALGFLLGFLLFFFIAVSGDMTGMTPVGSGAPPGPIPPGPITPPVPPPTTPTDCPIPKGVITCGSQFTPINGCGHCGIGYPPDSTSLYCGYPGTKYAIDVAGFDFQTIYLPKVENTVVNWNFVGEEKGATEAIQKYTGSASVGGSVRTYYLQFHHTQPGSGNSGAKQSGDAGGKICGNGCNEGHVHIQIGSGGDNPGSTGWLDSAQYFCRP